jgi:sugar transferase EpsL
MAAMSPGVYGRIGKRWLDVGLALVLLLLLSPALAITALLVRITCGRRVLFRQVRPGLYGRPFTILKYRTMTDARDAGGRPLPDGARLTALGRWLRANSLDELPELINVLRGEMSLVGPRPLLMQYLERYTPEQLRRHEVRPGITGWAQVRGRNGLPWEQKFVLDLWYVDHVSLRTDLTILVQTIWKAARREGINQDGEATVQEFLGSRRP